MRKRVGNVLKSQVDYFVKKIRDANNGRDTKALKAGFWSTLAIHPIQILQAPSDVIAQLEKEKQAIEMEKKAYDLNWKVTGEKLNKTLKRT